MFFGKHRSLHKGSMAEGNEQPLCDLRDRIVDTSVEAAEEVGWKNLRLRKVAQRLGVPLTAVLEYFRDTDAGANAWFTRPLRAMVRLPEAGFEALSARERVHVVLMRWFDAHAAHCRVVGEMLRAKLYPSHPQHWVPMIFSPSRLIHWVREVALLHASGRRRLMEEIAGFESTTTIGTGQVRNIGVHGMKAQAAFITRLFPIAA